MEGALTQRFDIQPALLTGRRIYEIDGHTLRCTRSNGSVDWTVNLKKVDYAAFVEHTVQRNLMWRFDLVIDGNRESISLTMNAGTAGFDPDRPVFVDLVEALCTALEEVQPGFEAGVGEYGGYRTAWFVLGLLSLLTGGGILIAALVTGVSVDRLMGAAVGMGLLILMGLVLIRQYHPWQEVPKVPATTLAQIVRVWAERKG